MSWKAKKLDFNASDASLSLEKKKDVSNIWKHKAQTNIDIYLFLDIFLNMSTDITIMIQ